MTATRVVVLAKLAVGIALLGFLVSRTELPGLLQRLATLDPVMVALVLVLPHVGIGLSSVKWRALLGTLGQRFRLRRLFALYMIGTFFNNFLPTMFGGDLVKVYQLSRESGSSTSVVAATFMERFVGLAALVTLLPLASLRPEIRESFPLVGWVVALAVAGYVALLVLIFSGLGARLGGRGRSVKPLQRLMSFIEQTRERVVFFRNRAPVLIASYLISVVFYFVTAAAAWAAVASTGAEVGFDYVLAVVPVILLAGMVPVSINGLGVTEAGYVLFLGIAGVSTLDAVTMALLIRARVLVTAVAGGVIFALYRPSVPTGSPLAGTQLENAPPG